MYIQKTNSFIFIIQASVTLLVSLFFLQACGGGSDSSNAGFTIRYATPDEDFGSVPANTELDISFTRPVLEKSVTSNTFWLLDEHDHQKVKGTLQFSDDKTSVKFIPEGLAFERHYSVTVHHSITDTKGEHLQGGTRKWSFNTQKRPAVLSFKPDSNATEVNTNSSVRVEFEEPVSTPSVTNSSFKLVDASGAAVAATITVDKSSADLKPVQPLALNARYTVSFDSTIVNTKNSPIFETPFSYSFTTRATPSSTFLIGTREHDEVRTMTTDAQGNIYVAGQTDGEYPGQENMGQSDAFVAKYSAAGNLLWAKQFGTPKFETVGSLVLSDTGDLYIAGNRDNPSGPPDMFFAKVTSAGALEIDMKVLGDPKEYESNTNISKDSNNSFYVSGTTRGALAGSTNLGEQDLVVAKYDNLGNQVWAKQFGSTGEDIMLGAFAGAGNIYVVAQTLSVMNSKEPHGPIFNSEPETFLYTLDSAGNLNGDPKKIGTEIIPYITNGMRLTTSGNIAMAGMIRDVNSGDMPFVAQLNPIDGSFNPTKIPLSDGGFSSYDAMTVDAAGNFYLASSKFVEPVFPTPVKGGEFTVPVFRHMNLFVQKISAGSDTFAWSVEIAVDDHATITNMVVDAGGDLIASGYVNGGIDGNAGIGAQDGFVIKINAAGQLK